MWNVQASILGNKILEICDLLHPSKLARTASASDAPAALDRSRSSPGRMRYRYHAQLIVCIFTMTYFLSSLLFINDGSNGRSNMWLSLASFIKIVGAIICSNPSTMRMSEFMPPALVTSIFAGGFLNVGHGLLSSRQGIVGRIERGRSPMTGTLPGLIDWRPATGSHPHRLSKFGHVVFGFDSNDACHAGKASVVAVLFDFVGRFVLRK
jgi:hypothetical protein